MSKEVQSAGEPGAPSCSKGQQAELTRQQREVAALSLVLHHIASQVQTSIDGLNAALANDNVSLAYPCLDTLARIGALADAAAERHGHGAVNGTSPFAWLQSPTLRDTLRQAGWTA